MNHKNQGSGRTILAVLLTAVAITGIGYFVYAFFKVRHVQAAGNAFYTAEYVSALAGVPEETHMFAVDAGSIEKNIEGAEPYLHVIAVTRTYPDTVTVKVEERRPEAILSYNGQYLLVDLDGVVLETIADRSVTDRPLVEGIGVAGVVMGQPITTSDTFKLSVLQQILQELDARDLFSLIDVIDLTNINNIQLVSTNGLRIRFGQAEKISDKVKWIQNRLPALEREGQAAGTLDVSAGSFATYTMVDGASPASAGNTPDPDAQSSPAAEESSTDDTGSSSFGDSAGGGE